MSSEPSGDRAPEPSAEPAAVEPSALLATFPAAPAAYRAERARRALARRAFLLHLLSRAPARA